MKSMDDNLVGYLLDALDETTHREIETHLRAHPEARRKLERLRAALEPLEADRSTEEPPPGLVNNTLALIADVSRRSLPHAPRMTGDAPVVRGWWRRSEVIAASVLALIAFGVGAAWLAGAWRQAQQTACQENLRVLHGALVQYSELHDGAFPRIEEKGPRSHAGMFVPILADAGVLPEKVSLVCPACGGEHTAPSVPDSLPTLEEWYANDRPRFEQAVANMAGSYAYSLGYRDAQGLHGLRRGADMDTMPILADRPPFDGKTTCENDNSKNHGGKGQNVLFISGAVRFVTTRTLGGDDIYLNANRLLAPGLHEGDCVLGASDASP
jgi:hypothetical protein